VADSHEKEARDLDRRQIAAILSFCFTESDEVRAHGGEVLSATLLNKLKRFAAGKLTRNELEKFSEKIASNVAAIEVLAFEIKKYWGRHRGSNDA
jgi:hypothetical protein